jgi:signal transduction histidine kinase/CheY-like chemotaxis protein
MTITALSGALIITGLWLRVRAVALTFETRPTWLNALTLAMIIAVLRCSMAVVLYGDLLTPAGTHILFGTLLFAIALHLPAILATVAALMDRPIPKILRVYWVLCAVIGMVVALFGIESIQVRSPNWVNSVYKDGEMNAIGGILTVMIVFLYGGILYVVGRGEERPSKAPRRMLIWAVIFNIAILAHDLTVVLQGLNNPYLSIFGMVALCLALSLAAEELANSQVDEITRVTHEAEARAEARTSFLSHMSHQVRTPLTEIRGLQYLLSEHADSTRQIELAEALGTSAEILRTLIDDLLDYESIDTGLLELDESSFSPRQFHDDLQQFAEHVPRPTGVDLNFEFSAPDDLFLVGDVARLRQIALNLISNALKFTPDGSIRVRITARQNNDLGHFSIEVEDSGIGIASARQKDIFDSFTQGESGTSRRYDGSGLGLAISKRLSDLMKGTLELHSEEGQGTTFTLSLALTILDLNVSSPPTVTLMPKEDISALIGTRVLVVEDTPTNLLITRLLLEEMGCHVSTASDGMEALETLSNTAQHMVLMDLQMAPWDGFETTRRIRKSEDYGQLGHEGSVPIIAVTADVSPLARREAATAGCDAFLAKPFTRHELATALWCELPRVPHAGRELTGQRSVPPISLPILLQASFGNQGIAIERLETFQRQLLEFLQIADDHEAASTTDQDDILQSLLTDAEELGLSEIRVALSELRVTLNSDGRTRLPGMLERTWEGHRALERRVLQIKQSFESAAYPQGKTQEFPEPLYLPPQED